VVKIDAAVRIVTARETATGYTFRFAVKDRKLLASIKVGDPVFADFVAKTVKLRATDATPCCGIIPTPSPTP
jgi:Cu/Ag efflux protein CusF